MKIYLNPSQLNWHKLCQRPQLKKQDLNVLVAKIFKDVQLRGDKAVIQYAAQFDQYKQKQFLVTGQELKEAKKQISTQLIKAIEVARKNIFQFHRSQLPTKRIIETQKGVRCWQEYRAVESVGVYIPGGQAPLFSTVLMLGIPAQIAGCKEVVLCSPPDKNGKIHPAILYTAQLVGIKKIFKIGGIQAIAAMVFGTETVPSVFKIFGPGNQYVDAAKQAAMQYGVAIDLPAGPSELLVIADETAHPGYVAADMLSQAEHSEDSQVILITTSKTVLNAVQNKIKKQIKMLPRKKIIVAALKHSKAILLNSLAECMQFSNFYAPKHLIIATKNDKKCISAVTNAGSVFIGNYSCESGGDYASGTNHTLPTAGFAKNFSGVSIDSFVKKISFQELTYAGLNRIGSVIETMAEAEQLFAHKNSVSIRLKN